MQAVTHAQYVSLSDKKVVSSEASLQINIIFVFVLQNGKIVQNMC